ncbi:MAG: nucleotidyltransferase domain-containing protein [bacterium]
MDIEEAVQKLSLDNEEIMIVYLYGSFRDGYATAKSDVDVAVVVDEKKLPTDRFTRERCYSDQIEAKVKGRQFDVRIMNPAPLSFKYQVIKNGLLLFSRNETFREEFECQLILEYLDFKPYLDQYDEQFLKRLAERATA